jgi:ABC-type polysaccharide/polyol phosphate export permease
VLGIGFATAALNAYYRDFRLAVPLAVQLWLFATPVVYSITAVGARWRGLYAALNPLVGPIEGFRQTVGHGALPDFGLLGISAATGAVMLLLGHRILKALEPSLADVI